ncbi:MAG: arylsulfatase [Planctomycetaceae bacterium]|nr:arylsulfatase [Planctomycetaceae bacterium]
MIRAFVSLLLVGVMSGVAAGAERPNVVIFLADDAGWGDYSQNGNRQVQTPNIDSIAQGGVTLETFFVCPVCSPTRAEFLTGRYHPRGGVWGVSTGKERIDPAERTVADAFKAAGYATGAFGKWHNGSQWPYHPMARGFDEYFGHTSGHWGEYFDAPLEENGRMIRTKGFIVDVCTDRAIDFIDRNQEKPFLCYVPFTTPHTPWSVPEAYWNRFKSKPITQLARTEDKENIDETRCVLAMIENQDWNVGRVLKKLDELKLSENTIVLYFSDNGPNTFRWNGGMKGRKGGTDEGGVRSTCYCRWPAELPAGRRVSQIAGAIDLLPTLTSLAKVSRVGDKPLDGRDLSKLMREESTDWTDRMLFSTWAGKVSVRTQQHRLDHEGNLYDMIADPGQATPVNDREPEVAARLNNAVKSWRGEVFNDANDPLANMGKARLKTTGGGDVDPRPMTVGYREFPITMLPARDGEPHGTVRRSSRAPNCSFFVNWTSKEDKLIWKIAVHTSGRYAVTVDYTCPEADVGSLVEIGFLGSKMTGRVTPGWDPPLNTNQDTLPRPINAESQMKEFHSLSLGEIELEQGEGELTMRAVEIPGKSVMDVRRVILTLLE